MTKRNAWIVVLCYTLWGILPLYWDLLSHIDSPFVLCCRVIFSGVFVVTVLACRGRLGEVGATFRDRTTMKYLAPAALFITLNWGLYIWAVSSGRTLDASLGYYLNPFVVFALSMLLFKEKCSRLQLVAMGVALLGVLSSILFFGNFPIIALVLAVSFALYGALKKFAHADAVVSIAVENLLLIPFLLAFALGFRQDVIQALDFTDVLLLLGAGVVTAVPMILYSSAVNEVSFITLGFAQYISPTLMVVCSLITGEKLTMDKAVPMLFVVAALVIYSIAILREHRARPGQMQNTAAPEGAAAE